MLQTTDASGTVEYRHLPPKDQKRFQDSRLTEVSSLIDLTAYELLSLEDSIKFREQYHDFVLPSRFVDRWKPTDDGGVKAKSRIVILGFKDPHVLQLQRSAPTPTNEAFTSTMQVMASNE